MDKLSAVIITKNEERNIGRCIESLIGVADEVVVIDSFSSDKTGEICQRLGARFEQHEWQGYSKTKNLGNNLASHPYIFSIDADEAVSDELKDSIAKAKEEGLKGIYSFNRLTNYCGKWIKHGGWYPDRKVRIFPKGITQWEGEIHEQLVYSDPQQEHFLEGDLHHYSYYNFEEHRARADKYSKLTAQKLFDQGVRTNGLKPMLSYLGRFIGMYLMKGAILDGYLGFKISQISAASNVLKYKELLRLQREAS